MRRIVFLGLGLMCSLLRSLLMGWFARGVWGVWMFRLVVVVVIVVVVMDLL